VSARAARNPSASSSEALLSIGQVLARLANEFPELTNSKLRFLEEQGLVRPSRTRSGYRKFSAADVERVRVVLSMQRDHYLPLKVIRTYLADLDAGKDPAVPGSGAGDAVQSIIPAARRLGRDDVIAEAGATPHLFSDAVSASLIVPAESYTDDTVHVLRALVELQRSGIEPRHLRGFRAAAERELALIESALMPISKRGDAASRAKAQELSGEIAGHFETVRGSLIRQALGRFSL
jgi:DNA-binding transcriptional MerR regulator